MAQIRGHLPETGKTTDWHPLACTKMPDGTYVLKVDTELTIDSLSLNLDNIKIASTDQTVGNAKYIKVKSDGTVYIEGLVTVDKGNPVVYTGNANIAPVTVTFVSSAKHIQVENMDGSNDVYISFDSGSTWRTVQVGYTIDVDCDSVSSIDIKADADGTPYEILTNE